MGCEPKPYDPNAAFTPLTRPLAERWAYCKRSEEGPFFGDFPTWRDAVLDALHHEQDVRVGCWVGKCEPPVDPENYITADHIIEHIACQDEYNGEWAGDWPGATKEQEDELTDALRSVVAEWIDRHGLHPKFFTIPCPVFVTKEEALDPACDPFAARAAK